MRPGGARVTIDSPAIAIPPFRGAGCASGRETLALASPPAEPDFSPGCLRRRATVHQRVTAFESGFGVNPSRCAADTAIRVANPRRDFVERLPFVDRLPTSQRMAEDASLAACFALEIARMSAKLSKGKHLVHGPRPRESDSMPLCYLGAPLSASGCFRPEVQRIVQLQEHRVRYRMRSVQ